MDLYMLNPCSTKIWWAHWRATHLGCSLSDWTHEYFRVTYLFNTLFSRFVIELCEPIQVKQLDIANFELFSSTPKDFLVSISDRYKYLRHDDFLSFVLWLTVYISQPWSWNKTLWFVMKAWGFFFCCQVCSRLQFIKVGGRVVACTCLVLLKNNLRISYFTAPRGTGTAPRKNVSSRLAQNHPPPPCIVGSNFRGGDGFCFGFHTLHSLPLSSSPTTRKFSPRTGKVRASAVTWSTLDICPHPLRGCVHTNMRLNSFSCSAYRYPTSKWLKLGTFHARDERIVQSFPLDEQLFAKYLKVLLLFPAQTHPLYIK